MINIGCYVFLLCLSMLRRQDFYFDVAFDIIFMKYFALFKRPYHPAITSRVFIGVVLFSCILQFKKINPRLRPDRPIDDHRIKTISTGMVTFLVYFWFFYWSQLSVCQVWCRDYRWKAQFSLFEFFFLVFFYPHALSGDAFQMKQHILLLLFAPYFWICLFPHYFPDSPLDNRQSLAIILEEVISCFDCMEIIWL